jgi:hypothetical protein
MRVGRKTVQEKSGGIDSILRREMLDDGCAVSPCLAANLYLVLRSPSNSA